jgi:hypothetical protein
MSLGLPMSDQNSTTGRAANEPFKSLNTRAQAAKDALPTHAVSEQQLDYLRALYLSTLRAVARAQELATKAELALLDGVESGSHASGLLEILRMQRDAVEKLRIGLSLARLYVAASPRPSTRR